MILFPIPLKRLFWVVWIGAFAASLYLLQQGSHTLPARVASHFDIAGKPNGWAPRETLIHSMEILLFGVNALFVAMLVMMHRIPPRFINLPNKDFWFSTPELEAVIRGKLAHLSAIIGAWVNSVILLSVDLILKANGAPAWFSLDSQQRIVLILVGSALLGPILLIWTFQISRRPY